MCGSPARNTAARGGHVVAGLRFWQAGARPFELAQPVRSMNRVVAPFTSSAPAEYFWNYGPTRAQCGAEDRGGLAGAPISLSLAWARRASSGMGEGRSTSRRAFVAGGL